MYRYGIVVIGYKNEKGVKRLLTSLNKADYFGNKVLLIISIDHSDDHTVYNVAKDFRWKNGKKIIRTFPEQLGLRNHVLKCGNYLNEYNLDSLIVFEDDMMPSMDYFYFVKSCTEKYIEDKNIPGISLYTHCINFQTRERFEPLRVENNDVYFFQCAQSRGQVWFRNQWNEFISWYEDNKDKSLESPTVPKAVTNWPATSWLKYHIAYCIEKDKYFVYPYISFSTCFGDVGQHIKSKTNEFQVLLSSGDKRTFILPKYSLNEVIYDAFFENKKLSRILGFDGESLLVDLYGHHTVTSCDYLITSVRHDFPLIKKWSNSLIPLEMNIISEIEGDGIYLYDLRKEIKPVNLCGSEFTTDSVKKLFLYGSGIEGEKWLRKIGEEFIFGFIDSDLQKAGNDIYGKRIYSIDEIKSIHEESYIFISANTKNKKAILTKLEENDLLNKVVSVPYVQKDVRSKFDSIVDFNSVFEGKNFIDSEAVVDKSFVGYGSYISRKTRLSNAKIGRYSCIGPNVSIVSGQHPTNTFVSISPYFYSVTNSVGETYVKEQLFDEHRYTKNGYQIEIGNDVWIGANVSIMEGVTIADGTIVAAGANVVNDTEPYSIIGGNPAKIIKYRFEDIQIKFLLDFKWWNREIKWIEENAMKFRDINLFIKDNTES